VRSTPALDPRILSGVVDRVWWCPQCEVLGRGSDRCWNCGRLFEPRGDRRVERMKDLLEPEDEHGEEMRAG
jgi:hypothetical protein